MQNKSYGRSDGKGRRTKVTLWNRAVDDVAGVVARLALMTKNIESSTIRYTKADAI